MNKYIIIILIISLFSCDSQEKRIINAIRKKACNSNIKFEKKILDKEEVISYNYVYRGKTEYNYTIHVFSDNTVIISDIFNKKTTYFSTIISNSRLNELLIRIQKVKEKNIGGVYEINTIINQEYFILESKKTHLQNSVDFIVKYYNYSPHKDVQEIIKALLKTLNRQSWKRYK